MEMTEELFKIGALNGQDISHIFEYCPEGVVIKDLDFNYLFVNDSYCNIFGQLTSENIINLGGNKLLSKENINLVHDADTEVMSNKIPLNYVINIDENRILSVSSSPIVSGNIVLGLISIIKDITQEELIKEKFVNKHFEYINREKQLQAQRETFVASIGHDLKNPTIAQIRSLELLLKGSFGQIRPEQKEIIEMILDSCRYMNGMLSSLLATYRNYGGAIKLNFEKINFITLLSECVSEMLYVAKDKEINILTEAPILDLTICADKVQLKRVIMNLLSNGIKYAFKDTDLKLKVWIENEFLFFQFENESFYLSDEKCKTLFSKYVSYSGVSKELGNGLGLYASKRIIESHNGVMYVHSYKDNRNIFGFKIPVKQDAQNNKEIVF